MDKEDNKNSDNNTFRRRGKDWTITETLKLIREYELLELPIAEIAKKHERSNRAIAYKLHQEECITDKVLETWLSYDQVQLLQTTDK